MIENLVKNNLKSLNAIHYISWYSLHVDAKGATMQSARLVFCVEHRIYGSSSFKFYISPSLSKS